MTQSLFAENMAISGNRRYKMEPRPNTPGLWETFYLNDDGIWVKLTHYQKSLSYDEALAEIEYHKALTAKTRVHRYATTVYIE